MSDLSRLLDDVYRSGAPAAAEPAWSSDEALDDAFQHWVPGPPAEAPEEERSYAQDWGEVAGGIPEAAVAFTEALTEQQAPPPSDPFGALHALLEEAIRLTPGADAEPDAAIAPAVHRDPVPETDTEALFLAYAEPEREPEVVPTVEVAEVVAPTSVAPVPVAGWTRSDDDILPVGRTGRGIRLLRRRRT